METVRKGIVAGKCWSRCSTVLGDMASDVEPSRGASAKLPGSRPPVHWTGRGQLNEGDMFGESRVLLFVSFRSVHECVGMDV